MTPDSGAREIVVGIGGVFMDAEDPDALAAWYERHLGIATEACENSRFHVFSWQRDAVPEGRLTTTWAISRARALCQGLARER